MIREVRDDQHGTTTGYAYGCRCHECASSAREYLRARRAKDPEGMRREERERSARHRERLRAETYSSHASRDEVRQWAASLGFHMKPSMRGRAEDALIARYNREHPERTYLRPSER